MVGILLHLITIGATKYTDDGNLKHCVGISALPAGKNINPGYCNLETWDEGLFGVVINFKSKILTNEECKLKFMEINHNGC